MTLLAIMLSRQAESGSEMKSFVVSEMRGNQEDWITIEGVHAVFAGTGTEEERRTWIITVEWTVLCGIHVLTLTMYIFLMIGWPCIIV